MSCYRPLKAFILGVKDDGKRDLKVTSYETDLCWQDRRNGYWYSAKEPFIRTSSVKDITKEYIEIPCGKCIGCRLDYSAMWANRCMLEAKYHEHNWFLTLTYNDEHLPPRRYMPDSDGVISSDGELDSLSPYHSLDKTHVQKFMKRLRKAISPNRCRFYAAGEYGTQSHRPHYHLILFGLELDDLKPIQKSKQGYTFYTSELIERCWRDEKGNSIGFHIIGDCTWETCAYVARYVTKKHKGLDSSVYDELQYEPEFTLMSRKPGIGYQYYEENKEKIYETEEIFLSLRDGSKTIRPPAYYDRLYDIDYPSDMAAIKEHRIEKQKTVKELRNNLTSLQYLDMLKSSEYIKSQKVKALKRGDI